MRVIGSKRSSEARLALTVRGGRTPAAQVEAASGHGRFITPVRRLHPALGFTVREAWSVGHSSTNRKKDDAIVGEQNSEKAESSGIT